MDIVNRFCRSVSRKLTRRRLSRMSNGETDGMTECELARWRIKNDPNFQPTEQDLSELVDNMTKELDKMIEILETKANEITLSEEKQK